MTTPPDYSDVRLLASLRLKRAGEPLPASSAPHFHDADIYAADPSTLTSAHAPAAGGGDSWLFFTHVKPKSSRDSRKSRQVAGGAGTWHSERAPRPVLDDEGSCVGHIQYFSYKIKTGKSCGERTHWYMVEFTDEDHQQARKRKPTDEQLSQVSSPVKAKRRLLNFPAASVSCAAASSQEPVSSEACYELADILKSVHRVVESKPSQDEAEPEASQEQIRSCELFPGLESLFSGLVPEASQEQIRPCELFPGLESLFSGLVPEPSQDEDTKSEEPEKLSSRGSYNLQLQGKSNATFDFAFWSEPELSQDKVLDSAFRSELEPSKDKVSESILQRFWTEARTEAIKELEVLPEKLLLDKSNATLDSAFRSEPEPSQDKVLDSAFRSELEPSQDKVSESIIQRFWTEARTEAIKELEGLPEKLLLDKSNATLDSAFRSEPEPSQDKVLDSAFRSELEPSQDKVSESIIQRFWTEARTEALPENLLLDKSNATLDSAFRSEPEPSQDKVSESIIQRFWTSETETSLVDRAMMNCSFLMAGGAPPMPVHCAPEAALSSASWIGNDITMPYSSDLGWFAGGAPPMPADCVQGPLPSVPWIGNAITSSELGSFVGAPMYNELGGIASGEFTGTGELVMGNTPFGPAPPAAAGFSANLDIWSY